jgi:putative oxidoreductase
VYLQRLFSTFAGGWPGIGLLLQRLLTATALLYYGFPHLGPQLTPILPQMIAASAGIPLLVGLWTPMAGTLVAIVEVWIAFSRPASPFISIMLATLGATLAMIGPGAWSIDARLFGRKHIETLGR